MDYAPHCVFALALPGNMEQCFFFLINIIQDTMWMAVVSVRVLGSLSFGCIVLISFKYSYSLFNQPLCYSWQLSQEGVETLRIQQWLAWINNTDQSTWATLQVKSDTTFLPPRRDLGGKGRHTTAQFHWGSPQLPEEKLGYVFHSRFLTAW